MLKINVCALSWAPIPLDVELPKMMLWYLLDVLIGKYSLLFTWTFPPIFDISYDWSNHPSDSGNRSQFPPKHPTAQQSFVKLYLLHEITFSEVSSSKWDTNIVGGHLDFTLGSIPRQVYILAHSKYWLALSTFVV